MFNDVFTALTSRKTELCKILYKLFKKQIK